MRLAFEPPEQLEVLASRQAIVERRSLRHPADTHVLDTLDRSRARLERAGQERQQGRLSCAVRADERECLRRTNVDGGGLDDLLAIERDCPLYDVLLETPDVAGPLGAEKLRALTDPANYLGAAQAMVDRVLNGR